MFVGHDHNNSFYTNYQGIDLGYCQGAGFNTYGPGDKRGVRIFTFDENDVRNYETYYATIGELCDYKPAKPFLEFLFSQGCEVMVPGLLGFFLFKTDNRLEDIKLYGGKKIKKYAMQVAIWFLTKIETELRKGAAAYGDFCVPEPYSHIKEKCTKIIGAGCKMGEGWLLTAEMMELIESGYGNIVCAQPFGCLPNHIVGKGMIRKLKELYPQSNIVPVDYDPGATKVNQENRIKLMLANARENMAENDEKPIQKREFAKTT
jgi:predicted nucleotide-binding protein (sugar kinase/HSP70/actin superfamily)